MVENALNPLEKKAESDSCFFCENGSVLHSVKELELALSACTSPESKAIFEKHVTSHKNDFSSWIRDVFGLDDLAHRIESIMDPLQMLRVIEEYEKELNLKVKTESNGATANLNSHFTKNSLEERKSNVEGLEGIDKLKSEISQRSERSDQELERVKRIKQHSIYNKADFVDSIDVLKTKYEELQNKISESRKEGKDMLIPSMMLRNALPKMTYFQVSQNNFDYEKILALFEDIEQEISYAKKEQINDLKKEVMEAVKLQSEKERVVK